MPGQPTRRELLKAAACAATVAVSGPAQSRPARQNELRLPREVRVAIVGLEGHYSEILSVAGMCPQIRVTAVSDGDADVLRKAASNAVMKQSTAYSDYRSLLDREKLDVVAVCGPNATRPDIICACAERKLAVVAEKPLAITMADLTRVRRAVETSGVPLTMLLPMRFAAQYRKMQEVVHSGEIGDVVTVAAQKSYKLGDRPAWMKSRSTFGGIIPYIGIHMIDLMRWTSGRDFVEAAAFQSNLGAPQTGEMENNAALIFRLDNNGTGSLRMDYLRPDTAPTHGDDRLRIAGTRGVVEFQEGRGVTLVTAGRKPEQVTALPPDGYLFADFLQAVFAGGHHLITQTEIFRVSEIVLKARDAAEQHMIVKL
jgi:predicted dehydrogenase